MTLSTMIRRFAWPLVAWSAAAFFADRFMCWLLNLNYHTWGGADQWLTSGGILLCIALILLATFVTCNRFAPTLLMSLLIVPTTWFVAVQQLAAAPMSTPHHASAWEGVNISGGLVITASMLILNVLEAS